MAGPTQVFMKIDGIDGDAEPTVVSKYIRIYSFNWSTSQSARSSVGSGADRQGTGPQLQAFTITKDYDVSTPYIAQQALTNMKNGVTVTIKFLKTGTTPTELAIYEFKNCIFTNYQHNSGPERPTETLTIDYTEFMFDAKQTVAAGGAGAAPKVTYKNPTQQAS